MPRPRIDLTVTPATVLTEIVLDLADDYHIPPESQFVAAALAAGLRAYRHGHTLQEATLISRATLVHPSPRG